MNEVTFITEGMVDFGYEINKIKRYVLRKKISVFGCYEVFNNKRCYFLIKAYTHCSGYFIRKSQFKDLELIFPIGYNQLKNQVNLEYLNKYRTPIHTEKQKDIEYFKRRKDYQHSIVLMDHSKDEMQVIRLGNYISSWKQEALVDTEERKIKQVIDQLKACHKRLRKQIQATHDVLWSVLEKWKPYDELN